MLDRELLALQTLSYGYWRAAVNTTYEKSLTDPQRPGRTYRITVTVIEEPARPDAVRVAVSLRPRWGRQMERRAFVIGPTSVSECPTESELMARRGVDERRQHQRVTGLPSGHWQQGQAVHPAPMADVSVGGCYVLQADVAPVGRIGVSLELLPPTDPLHLSATVMHVQPGMGFGTQFAGLTTAQRRMLSRTLKQLGTDQAR